MTAGILVLSVVRRVVVLTFLVRLSATVSLVCVSAFVKLCVTVRFAGAVPCVLMTVSRGDYKWVGLFLIYSVVGVRGSLLSSGGKLVLSIDSRRWFCFVS